MYINHYMRSKLLSNWSKYHDHVLSGIYLFNWSDLYMCVVVKFPCSGTGKRFSNQRRQLSSAAECNSNMTPPLEGESGTGFNDICSLSKEKKSNFTTRWETKLNDIPLIYLRNLRLQGIRVVCIFGAKTLLWPAKWVIFSMRLGCAMKQCFQSMNKF